MRLRVGADVAAAVATGPGIVAEAIPVSSTELTAAKGAAGRRSPNARRNRNQVRIGRIIGGWLPLALDVGQTQTIDDVVEHRLLLGVEIAGGFLLQDFQQIDVEPGELQVLIPLGVAGHRSGAAAGSLLQVDGGGLGEQPDEVEEARTIGSRAIRIALDSRSRGSGGWRRSRRLVC